MPTRTGVVGHIEDIIGQDVTSGYVEFQLQPRAKNILFTVPGEGIIDVEPVRIDILSSGFIDTTDLWGNDTIIPANTWYDLVIAPEGIVRTVVRRLMITGASYDLSAPVYAPQVSIVPQYELIKSSPIEGNLLPVASNAFTIGSSGLKYTQGWINNLFAQSLDVQLTGTITELTVETLRVNSGINDSGTAALGALDTVPTCFTSTNVTAATGLRQFIHKINNQVFVQGAASVTTTAGAGTASAFLIALPYSSNLAAGSDLEGVFGSSIAGEVGLISGESTVDRALVQFISQTAGTRQLNFCFAYRII